MDIKIFAVVVIYNREAGEAVTCQCLRHIKDIQVILTDNSTEANHNKQYAQENGWMYVGMQGNKGLPKAYNRSIKAIRERGSLVCLFDDDTEVEETYFSDLREKARSDAEAKVFLPQIYTSKGLLSPCIIGKVSVRYAENLDEVTDENMTAINSGMAIRTEVFDDYSYDEGYFLDYIDHAFIRDMKRLKYRILVLDAKLKHDIFFEDPNTDIESVIRRFKVFKKDFSRFCGRSLVNRLRYFKWIYNMKRHFIRVHGWHIRLALM